ncbi:tyrosine-type recombinase/integrase [Desulforegula conservatrix]|uniref:tyrosine-type recombinase/integrase n=1 Tax=Desulforegula conservatrix TaxID=153026 RepID=UPI000418A407|nr:site-specific integrase [Desulforegula conservatrix]
MSERESKPSNARNKTDYPGVFYRFRERTGHKGKIEKVYYVLYKKNGKLFEEPVGGQHSDDMTAAKASRIRAELIEGKRHSKKEEREAEKARKAAEESKWTIHKLWESYILHKDENKSLRTDKGRYQKYLPSLVKLEPHEITAIHVDKIMKGMKDKSPQTKKHVLILLKRIVNYGVKRNLCESLKFHLEMPKVNNIKTEDLTPDELQRLLDVLNSHPNIQVANIIKMALTTGMRKGEILNLKWEDVDFIRGFITIRDPKGGKDAVIPLNEAARMILENHPRMANSAYIFPGINGQKRVGIETTARKIKKLAELPEDFRICHGLRHVFASMLASSGEVEMYTLQKLLTHKNPIMTQRYAHLRDETLKNASEVASRVLSKATSDKKPKIEKLDDYRKASGDK